MTGWLVLVAAVVFLLGAVSVLLAREAVRAGDEARKIERFLREAEGKGKE